MIWRELPSILGPSCWIIVCIGEVDGSSDTGHLLVSEKPSSNRKLVIDVCLHEVVVPERKLSVLGLLQNRNCAGLLEHDAAVSGSNLSESVNTPLKTG